MIYTRSEETRGGITTPQCLQREEKQLLNVMHWKKNKEREGKRGNVRMYCRERIHKEREGLTILVWLKSRFEGTTCSDNKEKIKKIKL